MAFCMVCGGRRLEHEEQGRLRSVGRQVLGGLSGAILMTKPMCPNCKQVDHGAMLSSDHGGRFYFTRCGNCNHGFMYNAKGEVQNSHEEPRPSKELVPVSPQQYRDEMRDLMQRINGRTPKEWLSACHSVCHEMRKFRGMPLWVFVQEITGHGSTYSMDICRRFGWDPHALTHKRLPT
jgi:hypothetical protein